ncbi:MAG: hypothetical protein JSW62_03915 [Thermoplasmatales archaeon]|nr:MAG: hypothetical protein JSW62_03915 [Thermoplasmatales archaeon]
MAHRYGIYQSTDRSCIFYKQDEDGNQSTFNIFVTPEAKENQKKTIFAFIDNEQMKKENWNSNKESDLKEIVEAFGGWASDAPIVFELEAQKSISQCLSSVLKKEDGE